MTKQEKSDHSEDVTAFKGFDKKLKCRGFQFEIGKTFNHEGKVEACSSGFHSCEYPLDVFGCYAPANSRFAIVKASGSPSRRGCDSKVSCASISIEAEISIPTLVARAVAWIVGRVDNTRSEDNTGYRSAATNTGDYSAATNTGYRSAATNTGDYSAATNTGNYSAATNTGYQSAATNTGDYSAATNTGDYSAATNTGYRSAATNTGDYSAATNTGDYSAATNTGYRSAATNTGYQSAAGVGGSASVAIATGIKGRAKAAEGSAIVLCYRDENSGEIIHIRASKVGDNGVRPGVWYRLNEIGDFMEVEE